MKKTSEYVSLGHPDKVADYISEYILDRIIEQDPKARYALEIQIKDNHVTYGGEITTTAKTDKIHSWICSAIKAIGYTHEYASQWDKGDTLDCTNIETSGHISVQSPDIAKGVNKDAWGDQGVFFGFYCKETSHGDGIDHALAKLLGESLFYTVKQQPVVLFGLDIKTQVTVDCIKNDRPVVSKIIVAIPMRCSTFSGRRFVRKLVDDFLKQNHCRKARDYQCIVNGTGAYKRHASMGDCGTTGRKLVVDFYGGRSRIGGGSPWTKDGSKADLTLNIYARDLAESFFRVAAEKFPETWYVETELSCCIGRPDILVEFKAYDINGNYIYGDEMAGKVKPSSLIKKYKLNTPRFAKLCEYGLFTKD